MEVSGDVLINRRVLRIALQRLADEPVLLLQGPRTAGKTYLLRELARHCGAQVLDLDDPGTLDAVRADAATLLSGPSPVLVDEYQHDRSVLATIKAELNNDLRPGRFILAGSTRSTAIPEVAEYLTGRVSRLPVLPFSQGEIDGTFENFIDILLHGEATRLLASSRSMTSREDYVRRIVRGGMPLATMRKTATARNRWFDDYIPLVLAKGVSDVRNVRRPDRLARFFARVASQTAQVLNTVKAAEAVGLDRHTAANYVDVLEDVYLIRNLPAWGKTLSSRTSGKPKIHLLDSGLAARLLRITPERLARRDGATLTEFGHLLETFVVGELIKQATWIDEPISWHHLRTRDADEVDLVLERDDGGVVGIEIKAGTRVSSTELNGLKKLQTLAGDAFIAGVALYTGETSYRTADKIYVLPVDRIWSEIQ